MTRQVPIDSSAEVARSDERAHAVLPDIAFTRLAIVNAVFVGPAAVRNGWVLMDAGIPGMAGRIVRAAEERFGAGARPVAVVLTHGHFDHVGSLKELAERWDVPIYAHPLELPYLDGRSKYPPPDSSVGGGLMSALARLYPRGPIQVGRWLRALPPDGKLPDLPGWDWIHTPGHTPGHIALWREADRTLLAGDAFITTGQESAYAVVTQRSEVHGPPRYYTTDWDDAGRSVRLLAALKPEVAVAGHGPPLHGAELRRGLEVLARDFDEIAVPEHGRYVDR
jgi:glyoxylase-like metal-dependent hydrolase (beta-lactamase superfamily II)